MNASFFKVHSEKGKGFFFFWTPPHPEYGNRKRAVGKRDLGDFIAKYSCNLKEYVLQHSRVQN